MGEGAAGRTPRVIGKVDLKRFWEAVVEGFLERQALRRASRTLKTRFFAESIPRGKTCLRRFPLSINWSSEGRSLSLDTIMNLH